PEALPIAFGLLVELGPGHGLRGELRRRREPAGLLQKVFDLRAHDRVTRSFATAGGRRRCRARFGDGATLLRSGGGQYCRKSVVGHWFSTSADPAGLSTGCGFPAGIRPLAARRLPSLGAMSEPFVIRPRHPVVSDAGA